MSYAQRYAQRCSQVGKGKRQALMMKPSYPFSLWVYGEEGVTSCILEPGSKSNSWRICHGYICSIRKDSIRMLCTLKRMVSELQVCVEADALLSMASALSDPTNKHLYYYSL